MSGWVPTSKNVIGCATVLLMMIAFVSVLYLTIPEGNKDLVLVLAGAIGSRYGTVVDHFFGSSHMDAGPKAAPKDS